MGTQKGTSSSYKGKGASSSANYYKGEKSFAVISTRRPCYTNTACWYSSRRNTGKGGESKGKVAPEPSKGKGTSTSSYPMSHNGKGSSLVPFCRHAEFYTVQQWTEKLIEADGTEVDLAHASVDPGQTWAFAGSVHDDVGGTTVGSNYELCTRVNKGEIWLCEGTYVNLYGCSGHLTWEGPYTDATFMGLYTITGGTGDFSGASGYIKGHFTDDGNYSFRHIYVD